MPDAISDAAGAPPRPARTAAALADRVATLSASASAEGGAVTVTVTGPGIVTGLRLDDRAQRMAGAHLSAEILRTIRRAQATVADQLEAAVAETVGSDSETGKAVLDGFAQRMAADPDETPEPVMPAAPFPTFRSVPTLPHQQPGNGFESGRDSRAR